MDLALNNPKELICHKTATKQNKYNRITVTSGSYLVN